MWNFRQFVDEYPEAADDWREEAKAACSLAAELRDNPDVALADNFGPRQALEAYLDKVKASPGKREAGTALWNEFTSRLAQQGI